MNTDDLIAKLMELDPEGNRKIFYNGEDCVYFPADEVFIDSDGDIIIR